MRIVLAYRSFSGFAGTEVYTLTVAEQLLLLGHDVVIHARELGAMAEHARERGVPVVDAGGLPADCDAVLVQDNELPYELAQRYPEAARVYVAHSTEHIGQLPPQADGVVGAWVALNDRVAGHLRAHAHAPRIARLHQPVDLLRFSRVSPPRSPPERVLVFGHDHAGEQYRRIERACSAAGLAVELVGRRGRISPAPERDIAEADIVIGIGRCVIEAIAARRAAYVSGVVGTDGWVTSESYPALEADGFSGRATEAILTEERLAADLAAWTPELGERGKDLAFANHDAARHAADLVELWRSMSPGPGPPPDAGRELERLARVAALAENRALRAGAEAGIQKAKAEALQRRLDTLRGSARYRIGTALARPLDRLRARGRPRSRD